MATKYTKIKERGRTYYVPDANLEAFHAADCMQEIQRVALSDFVMEGDRFRKNRFVSVQWLLENHLGEENITTEERNLCK